MLRRPLLSWFMGLSVLTFGCSVIVEKDVKGKGLGVQCNTSSECHVGSCDDGVCVASCDGNGDCPASTKCFAGKCQKPLNVSALWVGVVSGGEGWTLTHQEGVTAAKERLPYINYKFQESVISDLDITNAVEKAVNEEKADVILLNSYSQRAKMLELAKKHEKVKFLNCQGYQAQKPNVAAYAAHEEQAWWVAGVVAAQRAQNKIGYIGSFITPEVVRHISAFLLGARSVKPQITLEVAWIGFWSDWKPTRTYNYNGPLALNKSGGDSVYREELLTYRLIDDGAEVIAHGADNQRSVRLIETLYKSGRLKDANGQPRVYSVSNDNRNAYKELDANGLPNGAPLQTCLGSPFWNWTPMYVSMFSEIHRGTWQPVNRNDPMTNDPAQSVPGFNLNPTAQGIDDSVVRKYVNEISTRGWQFVFNGPYPTNGQRDSNVDGVVDSKDKQSFDAGEQMSEDEYKSMCWFPQGVYERKDPTKGAGDPGYSLVQARVPDAQRIQTDPSFINDLEGPPEVPASAVADCTLNK
ncbi:BMP family ABC transporter substrate-binding protein [Pendulispora albinea]|uniref:BMP family ABC transporter substrate-binding protein n=1 Tax=Pendulispora albinea TaxID=2741071 RepID=A0ABZ2M4Z1_9BACT